MSPPQIAVNSTASHMNPIANEAHISGTTAGDQRRFSRAISEGPCVIVDIFHLLPRPTLDATPTRA